MDHDFSTQHPFLPSFLLPSFLSFLLFFLSSLILRSQLHNKDFVPYLFLSFFRLSSVEFILVSIQNSFCVSLSFSLQNLYASGISIRLISHSRCPSSKAFHTFPILLLPSSSSFFFLLVSPSHTHSFFSTSSCVF